MIGASSSGVTRYPSTTAITVQTPVTTTAVRG